MGKGIWGDGSSYFDDEDCQEYDEYIEKLEREEREYDDWLQTRHAEPGDPDYDEFDSLTSVREYIEEHQYELTHDEIRALKEEYGIYDDEDDFAYSARKSALTYRKTTHRKPQQSPAKTNSTPSTNLDMHPAAIAILCIISAIAMIWAIIDFISLMVFVAFIVIIAFFIWLFRPIRKR